MTQVEHTLKHRVDHLEGLVDLLSDLGARQHDFAADENQQHDLGLDHAVDETREQLGLVRAEIVMARGQTLETNGELDVARTNDVLDLEVGKLGVETQLLDDAGIFPGRKLGVILRLRTSDDHLAGGKDQGRSFRVPDTHDHGSETLSQLATCSKPRFQPGKRYLGVVLGIPGMQSNSLEVQAAVKVDCSHDVP